jgi:predicted TIM-barrel enzyme
MTFSDLFGWKKPIIGVLHLLTLPGAPVYDGAMQKVYDQALLSSYFQKNFECRFDEVHPDDP